MTVFGRNNCQHKWEEVGRTFTHGIVFNKYNSTGAGGDLIRDVQRLKAGQTHVELKCSACGDIGARTLSGIHKH